MNKDCSHDVISYFWIAAWLSGKQESSRVSSGTLSCPAILDAWNSLGIYMVYWKRGLGWYAWRRITSKRVQKWESRVTRQANCAAQLRIQSQNPFKSTEKRVYSPPHHWGQNFIPVCASTDAHGTVRLFQGGMEGVGNNLIHFQHGVICCRADKNISGMGRSLPYKRQLQLEWLLLCSKWCWHLCQVPNWLPAAQVSAGRDHGCTQQQTGWVGRLWP